MAKTGYHHGDLRQQLIQATRALVEAKGPDNFSVSEACRAAGVSTAAPYKHFSDKEDMLNAVCLQGFHEMRAQFERALVGLTPGTLDAISAIGTEYVNYAEANPGIFRMMFATSRESEECQAAGLECYNVLLLQIARYLGRNEVDDTVLEASFPLWTYVHGLSFLRIDGKAEFAKALRTVPELVADATGRLLEPDA